jgi:hypothetical protein
LQYEKGIKTWEIRAIFNEWKTVDRIGTEFSLNNMRVNELEIHLADMTHQTIAVFRILGKK